MGPEHSSESCPNCPRDIYETESRPGTLCSSLHATDGDPSPAGFAAVLSLGRCQDLPVWLQALPSSLQSPLHHGRRSIQVLRDVAAELALGGGQGACAERGESCGRLLLHRNSWGSSPSTHKRRSGEGGVSHLQQIPRSRAKIQPLPIQPGPHEPQPGQRHQKGPLLRWGAPLGLGTWQPQAAREARVL